MAVEIPVVIDIEQAFDDAARRVDTAIRPLVSSIDRSTKDLKLNVAFGSAESDYRTLDSILKNIKEDVGGVNFATEHLSAALADAKSRIDELYTSSAKGANLSANERLRVASLREAIILLENEIDLRGTASRAASEAAQKQISVADAISRGNAALETEAKTIAELNDKISALRGKLENIVPKDGRGRWTKEWKETTAEIQKAMNALAKYKVEFDAVTNPGSIDRIRAEIAKLDKQWNAMSKTDKFDRDGNLSRSAQKIVDKYKELTRESEKYGQSLAKVAGKAKPNIDATTESLRKQSTVLKSLTSYAASYVSVFGLVRFAKQIRDVTGELEYQRVALGHLLQDFSKGNALFERIKEAAIESPFRIKNLVTYTKQLAAYRIEQEELFDTTKRLADISAGLGVEMNRLILAYGQVRAASVLRGQELRQFTEAGIPLVELLADKFTDLRGEMVSTGDVFKLISQRAVPFSMIADIFEDLTEKGGMFYKMQEEQARTLKGRWEKLKDSYDIALQSIGDTETFQKTNDLIIGVLRGIADNMRVMVKIVDAAVVSWAAYNVVMLLAGTRTTLVATAEQKAAIATAVRSRNISGVIKKIMGQAAAEKALTNATTQATIGTNALSRALGRLKVAMLTNPWLVAAAAILGVVMALTRYKKAADDASEAAQTLNRAVDDMHRANQQHDRISKLIKQYEDLSKVVERNAAQNETLARTMKKLSAEFPEYSERINDSDLSLEKRLKLVQDLNKEEATRLQNIIKEKKETLKASETKLSYAEQEEEAKRQANLDATIYYNTLQDKLEELAESGKGGRGRLWKFMFGGNEYDKTYSQLVMQRQVLDETEKSYNNASESVKGLRDGIKDLRKEIYGVEEGTENVNTGWKSTLESLQVASNGSQLFTAEQLAGWTRLYDVSKDLEKEWKKLKVDLEGIKAAMPSEGDEHFSDWLKDFKDAEAQLAGLELIKATFKFLWGRSSSGAPRTDPFITQMKNRIKFMKDFQKGYEDLEKYMSSSKALSAESKIMLGRGESLGLSEEQQLRAAKDLSKWYSEMIEVTKQRMKAKGAKGVTVTDLLGLSIPESNKSMKDLQNLLQELWDAKTDFDTDQLKKSIEKSLKKLSDDVKRSETARNFFHDMLNLTGDEDLATNMTVSIYGGVGDEFKDRVQKEMFGALESVKKLVSDDFFNEMTGNITIFDVKEIRDQLKNLPDAVRPTFERLLEENEKFNADWLKDLYTSYQKVKTYEERITDVQKREAQKRDEINKNTTLSPELKDTYTKASEEREAKDIAAIRLERLKDTYTWTKTFEDLDGVSSRTLQHMIDLIDEYIEKYGKDLEPQQLKELTRAKENAKAQQTRRNAYKGAVSAIKEYNYASKLQAAIERYGQKDSEKYNKALDRRVRAIKDLSEALEAVSEDMEQMFSITRDLMGVFASDDDASFFGGQMENISKVFGGLTGATTGIMGILTNPADISSWKKALKGVSDVIVGVAKGIQELRFRRINKEIEHQQDLLDELEISYNELEKAMENSFGSEYLYNYTKQLENLTAKMEAYNEQARLEKEKGKKADDEKIKDYLQSAADAEEQIADMRTQLSEFFSGTDLSSAADEFANAWIDAYKEFGSTTDAMSEKFNDMIQSMINKSLAAKIMQEMLQPIFDEIDILSRDGLLATEDIADIAALAQERIPLINEAMTNLMASLASAGLDVRQSTSGFKGISKDYATASEESILGLAAAVNTQNFYISYVPTISENVSLILASMTGGAGPASSVATNENGEVIPSVQQMIYEHLPSMHTDLYDIKLMLKSVITGRTTSTNTAYIAVK